MDTLKFLQRVLPSEGIYVSAVLLDNGALRHGFVSSIDELDKAIKSLAKRGNNIYYAVSSFQEKGNRKQTNVHQTKVVALDIDCGEEKRYPNQKAGLQALLSFVKSAGVPEPMIVSSGNGLHVYWVLDEALEPAQWKPLAQAFKSCAIDHGLAIDPTVTADSARVLRPLGTVNPKGQKPVKVLVDRPPISVETLRHAVRAYYTHIPEFTDRTESPLLQDMAVQTDFPPANAAVVKSKCQQIQWAVDNQDKVSEPMWYNIMGVAAFCHNPEDAAIEWSKDHPEFDASSTLRKMYHWRESTTGPTTCERFQLENPTGCKNCKVKGRIGSPARLGSQYQEVEVSKEAPDAIATEIKIPKPFKRTSGGIKITIDETDIDVCPFDIYPVGYGRDESLGYETVRYHWNRPHAGWQELVLRQAFLSEGSREFATAIADQGIVLYNKRQTEYFQLMLRSYMEELRQKRAMTNLYASMGWKDNFKQFVIGNTLLRRNSDGTVAEEAINLASTTQRVGHDFYETAGSPEAWTQFTSLLEKAHMPWHMFALSVGLSSVLYAFTGLKGLTVSLYGPTGGGKTLIQYWIQSLYGNPDKLHFASKFTQNTLFNRMGTYAHMPLTIDEVTLMADKDVADFIYWVSQGRDKARLTRSAEERDAKSWAMPVVVSTNRSFNSKMIASGLDTEAQMMRLLELTVPSHNMFTKGSEAGRKIYEFLMTNYGTVGRLFVKRLLEIGEPGIRAMIAEATSKLKSKYGAEFSGEERFWEQSISLADLAAELAFEWDLIQYNPRTGIEWVLEQLGAVRNNIAENKSDSFDILADFLNDNANAAVTVMHTGVQKPAVDMSRLPRADIRVRFDVFRNSPADSFNKGTILIDRTYFRKWLSAQGVDYKRFMAEMNEESAIATPRSQKAYLGKDTPIKLAQCYVVGINLNHPRLMTILDDADTSAENLAFGQLQAV